MLGLAGEGTDVGVTAGCDAGAVFFFVSFIELTRQVGKTAFVKAFARLH